MTDPLSYTWPGSLNWRALDAFDDMLVRRSADTGEWVIGLGSAPGSFVEIDDPAIGHLGYDFSEVVDHIHRRHAQQDGFGEQAWWVPERLLRLKDNIATEWTPGAGSPSMAQWRSELFRSTTYPAPDVGVPWHRHTTRERYLGQVHALLGHIQRGDIYEVNYCTERSAVIPGLDPYAAFDRLLRRTDAPFAAFYRRGHCFALCMSPERYLHVEGQRVTTEPMKGTRKRGVTPAEDQALVQELATDAKERSENIMAVDVARHDLSRVAASRSVRVDGLCEVRTYPNVHQLVSTVRADLREGLDAWDVVRASFPMASMTGAPKRRAMQLIDEVEDQARGLFSGSLGYRLPDGTLDLNVVIRTITYDSITGRASLITGSAITAQSDPAAEWEECEVKARGVLEALGPGHTSVG